jgi:ribonuclease inhibitor
MIRCELDADVATTAAVYRRLAHDLQFPAHFRPNLDALWDVLTRDVKGPVEIHWRNSARARKKLGPAFARIVGLLREVEAERDDFRLTLG